MNIFDVEEVKKKKSDMMDELIYNKNYKESEDLVMEKFKKKKIRMFVSERINDKIENY
jgi:hypothetical protein